MSLIPKGASCCEENDFVMKNFTNTFNKIGFNLRSMPPLISGYVICVQDLIFNTEAYNW